MMGVQTTFAFLPPLPDVRLELGRLRRTMRQVHGTCDLIKNQEDVANVQLEEKRYSSCERFNLPIKFTVPELDSNVTISIRLSVHPRC